MNLEELFEQQLLSEMIVQYRDANKPEMIIAFKESIWILGASEPEQYVLDDIAEKTGLMLPETFDTYDIIELAEERPDVLIAMIGDDYIYLDSMTKLNPITSKLLRKVSQHTGLEYLKNEYIDNGDNGDNSEIDVIYNKYQMLGEIPDTAFHGTSTRYIQEIMTKGLRSGLDNGNWKKQNLQFNDRVFLSSDINYSYFHANRTAVNTDSVPIIIEFKIPDKSKIGQDYDVATDMYGLENDKVDIVYTNTGNNSKHHTGKTVQQHSNKTNFTRETGIFSYKGRIPASHIISIIVPLEDGNMSSENNIKVTDAEEFKEYYEQFIEYGFYDTIMFDEMKYYEEDEY